MSKVKTNKKNSVLKTVGLVFMVITLLAALALTNNTVRQFITDSFADGGRVNGCQDAGSPSQRCGNVAKREGVDNLSFLLLEKFRLAACMANPSSCGKSFKPFSSEAYVWYEINVNNFKCKNSIPGCVR